jgi:hypothetical protein
MLTHLLPTATGPEIAERLRCDGGVIVDDLASDEQLDTFFTEMKPWTDATGPGTDEFTGRNTRRTGGLLARSKTAQDLVMHPTALAACDDFLSHVTSYQLHLTQIIDLGPGSEAQGIHRDQWAFDFFPFPQGYEVQCNTIWAGDDFTEANGATRIVVGSNQHETPTTVRPGPTPSRGRRGQPPRASSTADTRSSIDGRSSGPSLQNPQRRLPSGSMTKSPPSCRVSCVGRRSRRGPSRRMSST